MNPSPSYFVRVGGEVRGPYNVGQLKELAEVGVISRTTDAAMERAGPWATLATHPEREEIFPARAGLGFKPTEFAVLNKPEVAVAPHATEVQKGLASARGGARVLRPSHPPELAEHLAEKAVAPPNEIELMVREVQALEAKFAPPPPPPKKWRPSGRLKLVGWLALLGNGVLVAIPVAYGAWGEFWTMIMFRGWFVIYNGALVVAYFLLPKN